MGSLAAVVLVAGWGFGVTRIVDLGSSLATMKANTALSFVLAATGLWVLRPPPGAPPGSRRAWMILGVAVALIAAITLCEDAFGWDLGIDQFLFADPGPPAGAPGRMSPVTAVDSVLLGAALVFLARDSRAAQGLALLFGASGLLAVAGHVYAVQALYTVPGFTSMAAHTATAFVALAVAVVCARPELGAMRVMTADTPGGALVRRLMPAVVLVPIVLGWLRLRGEELGYYTTGFGVAMHVLASVFVLGAFTWLAAGTLLRAELARRRDVEALRESEARKAAILGAALDCIISIDDRGVVTELNPAAERTFGYPRDKAVGRALADLIVPARLRDAYRQGLARQVAAGETHIIGRRLELPAVRADGIEIPAEVVIVEVKDGDRRSFTAFLRDLTDQKLAEEARARAEQLEAENWRIAQANRLKSELLASMSHELRTPLNSIIGFSELIHDGKVGAVSPEHREFLGDILTSARHLLRLINDILDLAKVEAGKLKFRPEPFEVERVVGEVVTILISEATAKGIQVTTELDPAVATVTLDAARLKQVLYNYVVNALKFTPEGGRVVVRTRAEGEAGFRLEVEDTGGGIAPSDIDKLFSQFHQVHPGRHGGAGLGLALTKGLVEAQGGTVGVRSTLGQGSTFHAVFPRHGGAGRPAS